ncbi:MAG: PTS lactose transporter subunit IIB [Microbacteriaceae bacterium]|nr:PTS lactose transporter subunit IIB [Microbacteriaceae bacterium]
MASKSGSEIKNIIVACEAGMGSSVMVAKQLAKQLKNEGVTVTHSPVGHLSSSEHDLVLCHRGLYSGAKAAVPNSLVIPFDMFLGDMNIAKVVGAIKAGEVISDE